MATKKAGAARTPRRTAGNRTRSAARRASTGTTRRRRSSYPRRRRPALSTTLGTALGTLVVATLLEASWPLRIGLVVGVLVLGLAYIVWRNRSELAAGGATEHDSTASSLSPDSTAAQGDSPDE